ncbi:uncharacterized protein BJ212DRAFT_1465224 [Suillus subaureus]|uniref:Uncharacterized protein n=1 Tax=Suillus subaureus TaxID=48587 RepID=A0A9P7DLA6_9AGAM|nr:uncharacterized protein BJ212DRAFT_1471408 [Suillus subaureus]XP_041190409.1 uncharacterized protein BJ212DRAFT_1465224 [Suillus subaureus]KAG1797644.1 hypothetical protein BJ212DRAFT_1471408 [Suillus subaureus]KAG1812127.1 hypothetical protein BJ212DRAFT_1465224 [Suillus subaureus]
MSAPATYYNVEVVQFWQGQKEYLRPYPLHWVIYIPTGPGIGNTYHILGNTDTYTIEFKRNQPHVNPNDWRGSFTVGRVATHQLALLERHLASVPITRHDPRWNSQNWVWECLRYLRRQRFEISWQFRQCDLQTKMCCLLEEWEFGRI